MASTLPRCARCPESWYVPTDVCSAALSCQVIHIKRFKVEPDGTCTKLCCAVHFPEVLRLSPDTLPTPPPEFGVGVRLPPPLDLAPGDSCAHEHYKKRTVSAAPVVVASSASPSRQNAGESLFRRSKR